MKKRFFVMLVVLVLASFCFSITAYAASSYTSTLAFQGEHTGPTREYTGTDMRWRGTTYTRGQAAIMSNYFDVSLYRKNIIGSSYIGTVTCNRTGSHNLSWSNVGSGKYYFYYVKARDGADVVSDAITMSMS